MTTRTIPKDHWSAELDSFSRRHEGWIVRVRVIRPDGRSRTASYDLPLHSVSADSPPSERVAITVGEQPDDHLHELALPIVVAVEETDTGAEQALRIRTADGSITTVEFEPPMRPEDVSGLMP